MRCLLTAVLLCTGYITFAQPTAQQLTTLSKLEEIIKPYSKDMIMADEAVDRYRADSFFTRGLVTALRTPNSFYYPFDSLQTVSRLYAPDSAFRIFTWQLMKDFSSYRQKGAIQMRTADGSLKLIPLFDNSEYVENPVDSVRNDKNWIGAIYYRIILKTYNNKKYYTLLGLDENDARSNKKWIEVLTFDANGRPVFGGRYFQYPNDSIKPKQPAYRFCLEYKKEAAARLTFDTELDAIVFDHLTSESKEFDKKYTLIPDGDYEGFRWMNGIWVYVYKMFDYQIDMRGVDPMLGNPPMPAPIKDKKPEKQADNNPYRADDKKRKENPKEKEEY